MAEENSQQSNIMVSPTVSPTVSTTVSPSGSHSENVVAPVKVAVAASDPYQSTARAFSTDPRLDKMLAKSPDISDIPYSQFKSFMDAYHKEQQSVVSQKEAAKKQFDDIKAAAVKEVSEELESKYRSQVETAEAQKAVNTFLTELNSAKTNKDDQVFKAVEALSLISKDGAAAANSVLILPLSKVPNMSEVLKYLANDAHSVECDLLTLYCEQDKWSKADALVKKISTKVAEKGSPVDAKKIAFSPTAMPSSSSSGSKPSNLDEYLNAVRMRRDDQSRFQVAM